MTILFPPLATFLAATLQQQPRAEERHVSRSALGAAMIACLLSGCSSLITYRPQTTGEAQSLKYVQGVGTLAVKNEDHEIFMYPTFRTQGPKQPTFTIGYANNSGAPVDFTSDNVKAYFRGVQVPVGLCDSMGSDARLWSMSWRLFSSIQMTGSAREIGRAYNASKAYMRRRYSSVSAPMHHISLRQGLRSFF